MTEQTNLVPKRRFKEFQNAQAWESRIVDDLADRYDNLRIPITASDRVAGSTPYYGANGIQDYVEGFTHDGEFILVAEDGANDLQNYPIQYVSGKVWVNNHAHVLQAKLGIADNKFLMNAMKHMNIEPYLVGGGRAKLNADVMMKISFQVPELAEQKLIGSFFASLDHFIALHQHKLEKMRALKSAYLSEMFPAEGEHEPKRRFAGFTQAWEERKAIEICSISTGKSNTQDRIQDGEYPFYVRSPIIERSSRFLFDEEAVLTVGDGVGTGKVFHYVNGKYDLHQRVYRMFDFCNGISGRYFYYFFSNHFYERVMTMTAKTSVDSVRFEMIADMDIRYPSIEEQLKITTLFANLDNLITLRQRKLEKLQNLKKAYLNEMFV